MGHDYYMAFVSPVTTASNVSAWHGANSTSAHQMDGENQALQDILLCSATTQQNTQCQQDKV